MVSSARYLCISANARRPTIHLKMSALRVSSAGCARRAHQAEPGHWSNAAETTSKLPKFLTIQQIKDLLDAPKNIRDKAILETLYSADCAFTSLPIE